MSRKKRRNTLDDDEGESESSLFESSTRSRRAAGTRRMLKAKASFLGSPVPALASTPGFNFTSSSPAPVSTLMPTPSECTNTDPPTSLVHSSSFTSTNALASPLQPGEENSFTRLGLSTDSNWEELYSCASIESDDIFAEKSWFAGEDLPGAETLPFARRIPIPASYFNREWDEDDDNDINYSESTLEKRKEVLISNIRRKLSNFVPHRETLSSLSDRIRKELLESYCNRFQEQLNKTIPLKDIEVEWLIDGLKRFLSTPSNTYSEDQVAFYQYYMNCLTNENSNVLQNFHAIKTNNPIPLPQQPQKGSVQSLKEFAHDSDPVPLSPAISFPHLSPTPSRFEAGTTDRAFGDAKASVRIKGLASNGDSKEDEILQTNDFRKLRRHETFEFDTRLERKEDVSNTPSMSTPMSPIPPPISPIRMTSLAPPAIDVNGETTHFGFGKQLILNAISPIHNQIEYMVSGRRESAESHAKILINET
eukprot:g1385.t1